MGGYLYACFATESLSLSLSLRLCLCLCLSLSLSFSLPPPPLLTLGCPCLHSNIDVLNRLAIGDCVDRFMAAMLLNTLFGIPREHPLNTLRQQPEYRLSHMTVKFKNPGGKASPAVKT